MTDLSAQVAVRPLAGAGIEMLLFLLPGGGVHVRPLAGAGIEIKSRDNLDHLRDAFAPSRGRELKYPQKRHIQHGCKFAPSWG